MKVGRATPHGPDDARELVGQGDRGLVVPASRGQRHGPLLQAGEAVRPVARSPLCGQQHRPGAVREQAAQIAVTALADAPQIAPHAGGGLARCEAEPTGEIAAAPERVNVRDRTDERGGGDDADAGDLLKPGR